MTAATDEHAEVIRHAGETRLRLEALLEKMTGYRGG